NRLAPSGQLNRPRQLQRAVLDEAHAVRLERFAILHTCGHADRQYSRGECPFALHTGLPPTAPSPAAAFHTVEITIPTRCRAAPTVRGLTRPRLPENR